MYATSESRYSTIFYWMEYYLLVFFLLYVWKHTVYSILHLAFFPFRLHCEQLLMLLKTIIAA